MKPSENETAAARLRQARLRAGYAKAVDFARAADINEVTYRAHEGGQRGIPLAAAKLYADRLGCAVDWLLTGEGDANVPLVGYVGAGHQIHPIDDFALGGEPETVDGPPAGTDGDVAAVEVRGDSMYPVYRQGDLIYYHRRPETDIDSLIGRECVVHLADGRTLVKMIKQSGMPGRYDLDSYNASPINDVEIRWAAPIAWVKRK